MGVLILVLVLLWTAALSPTILRKLSEHRLEASVARFRSSTTLKQRGTRSESSDGRLETMLGKLSQDRRRKRSRPQEDQDENEHAHQNSAPGRSGSLMKARS